MAAKRYRMAQWGTGFSGKVALQALIEHPDFDLVGVKVYSDTKAGRDAGELCGLGPTGRETPAANGPDLVDHHRPRAGVGHPVSAARLARHSRR